MRKLLLLIFLLATACGAQTTPGTTPAAQAPTGAPAVAATQPAPATATVAAATSAATTTNTQAASTTAAQAPPPSAAPATAKAPEEFTNAQGDRVLGRQDAPVTLIDYSDFQ